MTNEQDQLDQNIKESWFSRLGVQKPYTIFVCIMAIIVLGVFAFSSMNTELFPSMNMPYAVVVVSPNQEYLFNRVDEYLDSNFVEAKKVGTEDQANEIKAILYAEDTNPSKMDAIKTKLGQIVVASFKDPTNLAASDNIKNPVGATFVNLVSSMDTKNFLPTPAQMDTLTKDMLQSLTRVSGLKNTQSTTLLSAGAVMLTLEFNSDVTVVASDIDLALRAVTFDNVDKYGIKYVNPTVLKIDPSLLPVMTVTVAYTGEGNADQWLTQNVIGKLQNTTGVGQISSNIKDPNEFTTSEDQAWQGTGDAALLPTYNISIQKSSNAVTTEVAANVVETLQNIANNNSKFTYNITTSQADYINQSIGSVGENLVIGGVLALIILFLFLRSFRMTFAIGISIPLALVGTFVAMYFMGINLNIVSMSGLALAVGMLVDNSVVVLENIYRLRSKGLPIKDACVKGASQILLAMLASSLTTICVFFPMFFLEGLIMEVFTDLVWVVILSLSCSFVVAVMFLPSIVATFKIDVKQPKAVATDKKPSWWSRFTTGTGRAFEKTLRFCIDKKWLTVFMALVLFISSAALLLINGFILMPATDEGTFTVTATLTELGQSDTLKDVRDTQLAQPLYNVIKDALPNDMEKCVIQYSSGNDGMSILMGNSAPTIKINVKLKDRRNIATEAASDLVYDKMQTYLAAQDAGTKYFATIDVASSSMISSMVASDVSVTIISGKNIDENGMLPELENFLNAVKAEFTPAQLQELGIKEIIVDQNSGKKINKINGKNYADLVIKARSDADTNKIQSTLDEYVQKVMASETYKNADLSIYEDGMAEQLADTYTSMGLALIVGFLLIYLVMVAIFQSFLMPFIILICVPLGFTGAFLLLAMCGMPLSIPALVGFLILMGVVINNGILAVDYTNQARRDGLSVKEALVTAMKTRMRPIFMTALTTILALVPMAFGWSLFNVGGSGALMQPLAVVAIGGLLFGTVTTLLVVPAFYALFCCDKKVVKP